MEAYTGRRETPSEDVMIRQTLKREVGQGAVQRGENGLDNYLDN